MGSAADRQTGGDGRDGGLLDLTAEPLAGLFALAGGDSPLAHALRSPLLDEGDLLRAFSSALDPGFDLRAFGSVASEPG